MRRGDPSNATLRITATLQHVRLPLPPKPSRRHRPATLYRRHPKHRRRDEE
jgi:hypothetical protein